MDHRLDPESAAPRVYRADDVDRYVEQTRTEMQALADELARLRALMSTSDDAAPAEALSRASQILAESGARAGALLRTTASQIEELVQAIDTAVGLLGHATATQFSRRTTGTEDVIEVVEDPAATAHSNTRPGLDDTDERIPAIPSREREDRTKKADTDDHGGPPAPGESDAFIFRELRNRLDRS